MDLGERRLTVERATEPPPPLLAHRRGDDKIRMQRRGRVGCEDGDEGRIM